MNTPIWKKLPLFAALLGPGIFFAPGTARAQDCEAAGNDYKSQIDGYRNQLAGDNVSDDDKATYNQRITSLLGQRDGAIQDCYSQARAQKAKDDKVAKSLAECNQKHADFPDVWKWDDKKNKCISKADTAASKPLPDDGDCSTASVFSGDLKGQNCKKAMAVVKDTQARNSAVTDATTPATTAYTGLQATGATGAQDDAQTRQANIMKTLAMSKFATGLVNLASVAQLKSAASGAEAANSAITGAQKNLQAECSKSDDDQSCFYQNAPKYGVAPDQASYASYSAMKRGAQQSQDQADAANALAKSSMITGASDMLVGLQAMKAAQMANNNAMQLAPPPLVPIAPPAVTRFGDGSGSTSAPSLEPAAVAGPTDYGNAKNNQDNFGTARHGQINGGMMAGRPMGAANVFKSATSGVSGGGGGGGTAGGGGLRGGGGPRAPGAKRNSALGEYNLAGGGAGAKGGGGADKADANNPLADMLAKLFPQDQNGKPVVDARQIASANGGGSAEEGEQGDTVTASDLSIFEQISAKYRQLNGSGRF
ncbi:MAG: hypothetical protein ACXWR1_11425 [Bdellovibrionota bacterium]